MKKYMICMHVSGPGKTWKKVCKKVSKKQIARLIGLPKNAKLVDDSPWFVEIIK